MFFVDLRVIVFLEEGMVSSVSDPQMYLAGRLDVPVVYSAPAQTY